MDRRVFLGAGAGLGAVSALAAEGTAFASETSAPYQITGHYVPSHAAALKRIGDYAAEHMAVHQLPGMTFALVGPNGLDVRLTLGLSDLERRIPVRSEQLFHIGSISKSFTAVMIHQLAAEGRLHLDDPVSAHLQGVPLPDGATIRLNHLLAHSSGLAEDPPIFPETPDGKLWVGFSPGSAWSYSNLGFELLGRVVEAKDGAPLAACLKRRIFAPLQMTSAKGALFPSDRAQYAIGYAPSDPDADYAPGIPLGPAPFEVFTSGAGCVGANADDMAKWIGWLIGAGRGLGGPLMPDAQAVIFAKPQIAAPGWAFKNAAYGSGLAYVPLDGRMVMQHTGGMLAFHSSIHVDPKAGVGAFASVNSGAGDYRPRLVTAFACAMLRALAEPEAALNPIPAPVSWTAPSKVKLDTTDAEPEFAALAGRYAARGLSFGTVTLVAVKGGLAMPDGTLLEKSPDGYWTIRTSPSLDSPAIERIWFSHPVNGRPQNLSFSGERMERIAP